MGKSAKKFKPLSKTTVKKDYQTNNTRSQNRGNLKKSK